MAFIDDELEDLIETESSKVADDSMYTNATNADKAGLEVTVVRRYDGVGLHDGADTCAFCERLDGDWSLADAKSEGVFARHPGCGCDILYNSQKHGWQRQIDWASNSWAKMASDSVLIDEYHQGYQKSLFNNVRFKTGGLSPEEYVKGKLEKTVDIYDRNGIIKMSKEDFLSSSFEEIAHLKNSLDNYDVRIWYNAHLDKIRDHLDTSQPKREQAIEASNLRNKYRTEARDLMKDQKYRMGELEEKHKNLTFEQLVEKYSIRGFEGDALYEEIIKSSMRHNKDFDRKAGA